MRFGRITGCLSALVIAGAGAACAAPQTAATASGDGVASSAVAVESALSSQASSAPSSGPVLSSDTPNSVAAAIPSAPGTAGSSAKPVDTSAVVTSGPGAVASPLPDCTAATLRTTSPGKLMFTTGPARAPWSGANPSSGDGYESAVALAVATTLGYSPKVVTWTTSDPAQVLAGKSAAYDVAVSQFATPDETSKTVDFTTGYFPIAQALVVRSGSPAAEIADLSGLKSLKIGAVQPAQVSRALRSSGETAASVVAQPSTTSGLAALRNGSIDAVVVDLPAAVTAGSGITILGQLPSGSEQPRQFGMVLHKASPLTSCVSAAIDLLRVNGSLAALQQRWLPANSSKVLQ